MIAAPPRWRSLLFVPANAPRFIARAHERGADAVILDLEDSVPAEERAAARATLTDAIAAVGQAGAAVMVRVNHGIRALAQDLDAAVVTGVTALVLPKVESAAWVVEVAEAVAELELERGLPAGAIRFVLLVETPAALPHLHAIAAAHARISAISLGPEDFCAALGAVPGPEVLLGPNLATLHAARAAGILPLGFIGSIGDFSDLGAFHGRIIQARALGFRGALAIHPAQVSLLNEGFAPTETERDWATRVLAAAEVARDQGKGAFRVDGRMIDAPIIRRAQEILA